MARGSTVNANKPAARAKRKRSINKALVEKINYTAKLYAGGIKLVHIAGMVGSSQGTVFKWAARDDFKRAVEEFRAKQVEMITKELEAAMGAAMGVYLQALASKKESIRLRAAKEIMEMNGRFKLHMEVVDQGARDYGTGLDEIERIIRAAYEGEDRDAPLEVPATGDDQDS